MHNPMINVSTPSSFTPFARFLCTPLHAGIVLQVIVQPTVDVQGKTGEVVVAAELDGDVTSAELTVNHAEDSAVLEVCHRLDDNNVISPKVDLKTGDIAVRLNRSLGDARAVKFTAQRENVDWEYLEGAWVVKGNVPLTSDGSTGAISFKRSITL